jgi:ribosomal protein S12 methylthiotransferase accessory factor YcaO
MFGLTTSIRERDAASTLAAIESLLPDHDIQGFVDHTPPGLTLTRSVEIIRGNPRSGYMNLGKGIGHEATLASGLMEAIEMFTIEYPPTIELPDRVDPAEAPAFFTPGQRWTQPTESCARDLGDEALLLGEDLLTGTGCYTMASDHFLASDDGDAARNVTTNGLASGNGLAEARVHAIHELVERHVSLHGLRAPGSARRIPLTNAPPVVAAAVDELRTAGIKSDVFLLGEMFEVYVTHCSLTFDDPTAGDRTGVCFGWGAHETLAVAVSRALCEAVQVYATRRAVQAGSIPEGRMRAGMLVSAAQLADIGRESPFAFRVLHARLEASTQEPLVEGRWASDALDGLTSVERLDRLVALVRQSPVEELLSWNLSRPDLPYVVVKCAIPAFDSFV